MAIKFIGSSWEAELQDEYPSTDRFYLDSRQEEYPGISGSVLVYTAVTSGDNQSGSYNATGGHEAFLLPLTNTVTIQARVFPNFEYDVATDQPIWSWYNDANNYLTLCYSAADDTFELKWKDGGTERILQAGVYGDTPSLAAWHDICATIDLTTGDTTGSALYNSIGGGSSDATWSGNIDAKGQNYPLFEIRAENNVEGDYKINHVRVFLNKVATTAEVNGNYGSVKNEEIVFHLNGYSVGRTRYNISRFVTDNRYEKFVENPDSGSPGANSLGLAILNTGGEFSDEQYAAFDPTLDQFSGLNTQKYLQNRCRVEAETWYGDDFELYFTGRVDEGLFSRQTTHEDESYVTLSCEDQIADIAKKTKRKGRYYENYNLSNPSVEGSSLMHVITRLATAPEWYNFLANSSFENATIGNSWLVTGGTAPTFSRVAGGLFGSYQGDLVYDDAACAAYQTIMFTGIKKLNVGETWTFFIWLKCADACSHVIGIGEGDSGGSNGATYTTYTLAGGEGWVLWSVSRTITDSDSDRWEASIHVNDDVTLSMDGAMLIQNDRAINWFVLNNNDGASGVESADDADSASYDTCGFDVDTVSINHPWVYIPPGEFIWEHLKELGVAVSAMYIGMDECGTVKLRARLKDGYSDPSALETISSALEMSSSMEIEQANKLIGHGIKIRKFTTQGTVWMIEACSAFDEDTGAGDAVKVAVANGAYFPEADLRPFWAKYGNVES